ncbi:MAG: hypothetical protein KAG61_05400 [Bacteriovoracaceae bacterium]|nr:hypothetical protein [Bacteriovoracaceae bacterium]
MGLRGLAQIFFTQEIQRKWFGDEPDQRLVRKLNSILPETIPTDAELIQLEYSLLKKLIDADGVSRDYKYDGESIVKSGSFTQTVNPISDRDKDLIAEGLSGRDLREVLRISILTESNEWYHSDIITGSEKLVGDPITIMDWIHEHTFYIRKLGHSIRSLHIDHVHPSLEVVVVTDEKLISVTNGLSHSDYEVGLKVSEYQMYPLFLSAILPSGLKYTIGL